MIYRVTFSLEEDTFQVLCKTIDFEDHPYLVTIEDIEFEDQSNVIISPDGDKARKRFGDVERIRIPVSALRLVEEIQSKERVSALKAVPSLPSSSQV